MHLLDFLVLLKNYLGPFRKLGYVQFFIWISFDKIVGVISLKFGGSERQNIKKKLKDLSILWTNSIFKEGFAYFHFSIRSACFCPTFLHTHYWTREFVPINLLLLLIVWQEMDKKVFSIHSRALEFGIHKCYCYL